MNSTPTTGGSGLRILAAFTLGMIAMAAIVAVILMLSREWPRPAQVAEAPQPTNTARIVRNSPPPTPARPPSSAATPSIPTRATRTDNPPAAPTMVNAAQSQTIYNARGAIIGATEVAPPSIVIDAHTTEAPLQFNVGGVSVETAGVIHGKITLSGNPPPERPIAMSAYDPCSRLPNGPKTTRFYRVGVDSGLADVLVHLERVGSSSPLDRPWPLRAKTLPLFYTGCVIDPYIAGAQVGQKLLAHSMDNISHNVHAMTSNRANREVNYALFAQSRAQEIQFFAPDPQIRIKCNVHPWEFAYITVFDHPFFAVTNDDGLFELDGVPAGRYLLKIIHRKSGAQEKPIQIDARQTLELNFTFEASSEM